MAPIKNSQEYLLDYGLDDGGNLVGFPTVEKRDFSLPQNVQTGSGTHPRGSFPGVQCLKRGGDHSLPSNAEVRMCGAHASAPYWSSRPAKG